MALTDYPTRSVLQLIGGLTTTSTTATFTWNSDDTGAYVTAKDGTTSLVTEAMLILSPTLANSGGSEDVYVTGGTLNADSTEITYTLSKRGIPDGEDTFPPTSEVTALKKTHKANSNAFYTNYVQLKQLETSFTNSTVTETATAGEAIDTTSANLGVSIHTDGKYYKYNNATYPNYQGVVLSGQTLSADDTFTLYNLKSIVTGFTGLGNSYVYVDDGGAFTPTSTTTTVLAGIARNSTELVGAERVPAGLELTNAQAIDPDSTVFGSTSGDQLDFVAGVHFYKTTRTQATGTSTFTVTHNLGKKPKYCWIMGTNVSAYLFGLVTMHFLPSPSDTWMTQGGDKYATMHYSANPSKSLAVNSINGVSDTSATISVTHAGAGLPLTYHIVFVT